MNSTQITDLLLIIQAAITLLISMRAFYLYNRTRSDSLFSLALSMGVIGVGGVIGLIGDISFNGTYNTFWFRYVGQTVSYLFIFLSTLRGPDSYRRGLRVWHVISTGLLVVLLLLTPLIPPHMSPITQTVLSGSRGMVCLIICLHYAFIFFGKETRFSFLMSFSFFWITFGIAIYTLKFTAPDPVPLDYFGDSLRVVGLSTLLAAFFLG